MESHSIFMKLNSFLQCSFCKRPTFYNNHNVSAFISRGVSIPIGKAANLPRHQPTSKKICFEQEILLTHNLMDPQIIDPIHSALTLTLFHFPRQYCEVKDKFISGAWSFFVSSRSSSRLVSLAGVVSRLTVCSLLPGHCWQFGPITGQDGSRAANQSTEIRCI